MSLIKCPECGKDVSDQAQSCPNCGYCIAKESNEIYDSANNRDSEEKTGWIQTNPQPLQQVPKKKKTHGCLIAVIIVLVLCVWSCSIGNSDEKDYIDSNKNSVVEQNETVKSDDKNTKKVAEKTEFKAKKIYNGHKCVLKLVSGDENGFSIQIKNNSKKDYSYDVHSMSINGIMTNCNIYTGNTSVPSKKKGMMNVDFESDWLSGIDNVEYVDMIIWAYDDAKSFKDFETEIIRIKTNKFKNENKFKSSKGSKKDNGLIIQKEKLDTETFEFSVINKNKEYVEFDFENSSINGWAFEDDYLFDAKSICVYPNSKVTVNIDLSDFTDKNKINKINDIEFSLNVRTKGDYFKEKSTKKIKFK